MLNSSILDVAIGMAFIYLLLSLIASTIQEAIASLLQLRSANLEHGISSLFSGGLLDDNTPFVDRLYRHGLIMGLYRDRLNADTPASKSYLRLGLRWLFRIHTQPLVGGVEDPFLLPAYIPARTFAVALLDILKVESQKANPPLTVEDYLKKLCADQTAKDATTKHAAAEAMLALLTHAQTFEGANYPDKFRCFIENWYNDSMDRASGWYKKYTQNVLLVIGLILAIIFNVDSITVGKKLWFDKDARSGLISAAGSYVDKHTEAPKVPAQPGKSTLTEKELADQMRTTVKAFSTVSEDYLLPVGWHYSFDEYVYQVTHRGQWQPVHIIAQFAGWIITALALSLGAPFWFDLLNKFMVVRSTVKPAEKSRTGSLERRNLVPEDLRLQPPYCIGML